MTDKKKCTAVILAAGSGSRMKSNVAKQFMLLDGKPLIWYALDTVEQSRIIDDCILVTGEADLAYMQKEIVEKYHFSKVNTIVAGGAERYLSVGNALQMITDLTGYVFIHDGARPFLTEKILEDAYEAVDLKRALNRMTKEDKAVIELKYFEDLKLTEIAEVLGENVNTVKSRLYRGLRKLKVELSDTCQ